MVMMRGLLSIFAMFTQIVVSSHDSTYINGEFYIADSDTIYIIVREPVMQKIKIFSSGSLIYYPQQQRAFYLEQDNTYFQLANPTSPFATLPDTTVLLQNGFSKSVIRSGKTDKKIQYAPNSNKRKFPIFTLNFKDSNVKKISITSDPTHYQEFLPIDIKSINGRDVLVEYKMLQYENNSVRETQHITLTNISTNVDKDLSFTVPSTQDIEYISF